jgi:DNA-binding CsgD family transcriptional regulator
MTIGYQALTEKEKETLRLLLGGHDAKSVARRLGLSVHTINERLRDARRKMAVSSSREAARMLHEIERQAPQSLGDMGLGDAEASSHGQPLPQPAKGSGHRGRAGWIAGGIAMMLSLTLAALAALGGSGQVAQPVAAVAVRAPQTASEAEAVAAARHWLELVDAKDWKASYDLTTRAFRTSNTLEGWTQAALGVHGRFGPASHRVLVSAEETPAPPNGNMVVKFQAGCANKPEGSEMLTLVREDGVWKVSGIYVG